MNKQTKAVTNRLPFLDNLRTLMVILVLIFHSGASYASVVAFWPFHDSNPSKFIDVFIFVCDIFLMVVLFFIAGYFVLPSFKKRGAMLFLKDKLKLLGVPWLVVTFLVLPILDYMHYRVRFSGGGLPLMNFGTYWALSMKKIAEFHVGWMDMTSYHSMTEYFYQRYMWFLSLLLLFFTVFVVLYEINKRWRFNKKHTELGDTSLKKSNLSVFLFTGFLTILLFAALKLFVYPELLSSGWFSLGNLFQFQLGKMLIYAVYFGLGIYAYSKDWFKGDIGIGRSWVWGLLCFLLFGINMLILKILGSNDLPLFQIAHVVFYPTWILSFLGFFLTFFFRHCNRVTPFNQSLAANSYNMYLVHYIFPMSIPLLLSNWGTAPVMIKFGIVAVITVLLSYLISRFLIKPFPKLTTIGIIVFSVILAVVT